MANNQIPPWMQIDEKIRLRGLRWGFSRTNRTPYREQVIGEKVIRHSRKPGKVQER